MLILRNQRWNLLVPEVLLHRLVVHEAASALGAECADDVFGRCGDDEGFACRVGGAGIINDIDASDWRSLFVATCA